MRKTVTCSYKYKYISQHTGNEPLYMYMYMYVALYTKMYTSLTTCNMVRKSRGSHGVTNEVKK